MEIRVHGRGGQGGVTCAKILATIYAHRGHTVQAFGDYAGERSGAPVRAYARVGDGPIDNRNKVYEPDHLLVLDPSLLSDAVVAGLVPGGTLLINAPEPPEAFADRFGAARIVTVDATEIARRHGIGTRSVVIVNTAIAGAFARAVGLPFDALESTYEHLGYAGDLAAAREAWDQARSRDPDRAPTEAAAADAGASPWGATVAGGVPDLIDHVEGPAPALKTGAWRSQLPAYAVRLAPCSQACPAGNDVVGFTQALARQGPAAAAEILGRTTPFAAVCGRVCPGFCNEGCNRCSFDEAVDTRGLERLIADQFPVASTRRAIHPEPRRAAVVGSGPAGLTAAYHLARAGHDVVVYEREPALGGVLRTGIPEYRLPRDVLDREIAGILALGVKARCGHSLDADGLADLADRYDAVILATGLQWLRGLRVPGSDIDGIEQGIDFLNRINSGEQRGILGHVVVLGGGNTAMDCARSALRAGASAVTVAYRRTRHEMPAIGEEVDQAEAEGVRMLFQRAPIGFLGQYRVEAIELAEVDMGEPDDSGRRRPVVSDRSELLECDQVLLALGQSADDRVLPAGWTLDGNCLLRDGAPLPVFATGDVATGEGTVAHAIGDGTRVAERVLSWFGRPVQSPVPKGPVVRPDDVREEQLPTGQAARHVLRDPIARSHDFREVDEGLPDASQADRCMSCGVCTLCDTCLVYCPDGVIHRVEGGYAIDADYCKGCGVCVVECPRGAMVMVSA